MNKDLELAKKILPCPFCGSDAHHYPDGDMEGHSIMCDSYGKGCPTNTFGYETAEAAEQAWNTRAERDAEQQPNAEAVAEIVNADPLGIASACQINVLRGPLKNGTKLFTHAPSQGITPELALKVATDMDNHGFSITVYADNSINFYTPEALANYVDAILAELNLCY